MAAPQIEKARKRCEATGRKQRLFGNLRYGCPHLSRHYARVLEDMEALAARDSNLLDAAYVEKARGGLQRWVDGGEAGHLAWGVFHFRR